MRKHLQHFLMTAALILFGLSAAVSAIGVIG